MQTERQTQRQPHMLTEMLSERQTESRQIAYIYADICRNKRQETSYRDITTERQRQREI